MLGIYPSWDQGEGKASDEFSCNVINPFTLSRVREMLYRCSVEKCRKFVAITPFKDGVGFLLVEHINNREEYLEFLDCKGYLLCKTEENQRFLCSELDIDYNNKRIIIETTITFNAKF